MTRFLTSHIASFIVFTLVQILFFLNFNLYEVGFAFVYIGFIIFLPLEISAIPAMLLAFAQGWCLDLFYNTLGTHMLAGTLVAYCRQPLIAMLAPRMIDVNSELQRVSQLGFQRVVVLVAVLCFIHHATLLYFVNPGWDFFWSNLLKAFLSTLISSFVILSFKRLFFNQV